MMMDESIEGGMLPDDSAWRTEEGGLEICVRAGKVFFFLCLSTFIFLFFFFLNKLTFSRSTFCFLLLLLGFNR